MGIYYFYDLCLLSVMAVPATVIYFTCYDQLCTALKLRFEDYTQEVPMVAGAVARCELSCPSYVGSVQQIIKCHPLLGNLDKIIPSNVV